ncbi:lectin c-type domain-containing protein [Phthorimaea operculella]|nr:lectin c-type domain-containing protein [Phthorimaea operculella]
MNKLLVFIIALAFAKAHKPHFFRRDYTYIEELDAFYKVHLQKGSLIDFWSSAFTTCYDEGAKLFYEEENEELAAVKNLVNKTRILHELSANILVGIHDEIGDGDFTTVDGKETPKSFSEANDTGDSRCVFFNLDDDEYETGPCDTKLSLDIENYFVCKRVDNKPCSTIDLSYTYKEETKKCYKINTNSRSWTDAFHTCYMEGGMLVTIESNAEANIIGSMIPPYTKYFSGYRKIYPGSDFYSVKGKKLQDSGFQRWTDQEGSDDNLATCVVNYNNGQSPDSLYMGSENCSAHRPFICEMPARIRL